MRYRLEIKQEAYRDIQDGIDWYNSCQPGLGRRFHTEVKQEFKVLCNNPMFQLRYESVRCLPLKKFPCMIHYIVKEQSKQIVVLGVIDTRKNPEIWQDRK
jgi:toxin ParE1/3/4